MARTDYDASLDWHSEDWQFSFVEGGDTLELSDDACDIAVPSGEVKNNPDVECLINNSVGDIVAVPRLESTSGSEITSCAPRSSDMSLSRLETFIEDAFIGFVPEPGLGVKLIELKNVVDKNKIADKVDVDHSLSFDATDRDYPLIHTRLKGPVHFIPNVQSNILERATRKRKLSH